MGASAWAQDSYTTLYEKTLSGGTAWTADDITGWSGTTTKLSINASYGLYYSSQNTDNAYKAFTIKKNSKIKYEITWYFGGAVGRTSNYEYLQFGDNLRIGHMSYNKDNPGGVYLSTNAGTSYESTTIFAENYNTRYTKDLTIIFDTSTGEVESFVFDGTDVTSRISGALSGTFNTLYMGFTRGGSVSWDNPHGLVALKVSECEQTITNADYTVNYVDGVGNALKTAAVRTGVVGNYISLLGTDKDPIWVDTDADDVVDTKFIYVSDNASTTEITGDGTASCNVVFNVAPTYSYSFKTSFGTTLASGSTLSGETVSIAIPRYVMNSGTFYVYASAANNITYSKSMTVTSDNQEETVSYNDTGYDNVVYFAEAEDITGMTRSNEGQGGARSSMCYGAYATDNVTVTSLPAGKYTLTAYICGNSGTTFRFYAGSTSNEIYNIATTGSLTSGTSTEFNLTEATDIIIGAAGEAAKLIDFIYIQKTAEPVTVTDAGMATYVNSTYDLNFSETDIKAYKVKVSTKGTATLTKVDEVPAGTPVLLVKDGGATESIPVMAGAAAVTENDLVVGTGAAVPTTDGAGNTNMILNKVGGNVGFYFANGQTVATNRAYLHIATTLAPDAASARMAMVFGDETTGINAVQGSGVKVNGSEAVYNLNGQRVAQPTKGLYIVNGKKVLVK